jgi:hypothetical protein
MIVTLPRYVPVQAPNQDWFTGVKKCASLGGAVSNMRSAQQLAGNGFNYTKSLLIGVNRPATENYYAANPKTLNQSCCIQLVILLVVFYI